MSYFEYGFRDFSKYDYQGYAGACKLPNGEDPKIYSIENDEDLGIDIILSGDGEGNTIISLETEIGSWNIILPGYNRCHTAIANSIVKEFFDYGVMSEAIEGIVSDYGMNKF